MGVGCGARPREQAYEELRRGDFFGSTRGVGRKAGKPPEASAGNLARSVCPFLADRAAFFQILNVRKQEHEHGVLF